ncbi:MAG: hypothetical protein Q9162_006213 [Coniocarpon cinnabarinum]
MASSAPPLDPASTTLQTVIRAQEAVTIPTKLVVDESRTSMFKDAQTVSAREELTFHIERKMSSTGRGILIGMLSAFGSALLVAIIFALVYFFRYTTRGRILLDRMGRPGEFDDEQAFAREEEAAVDVMDDMSRSEYLRAKAFAQANPPESAETEISLSQFLAIQEKGVSAWEFEPELEIANCFVEGRTEIEFYDSECSVQSNLPIPKQNDVYYWEAKIYDKPDTTNISIGVTTKPYPLFRLPGFHKTSAAYDSLGNRRFNQPFQPTTNYAPPYVRGDVVGCGYRPRTGTVFFTRNGKKLDDVTHTLKTQNLFPTVGANGPCSVHVNFGQMGFVFIEANVKKWGLAPMTGSLAPPPPYGSEAGSILVESGQHGVPEGQGAQFLSGHLGHTGRSRSATVRLSRQAPTSPGPQRSPTDISLAQLERVHSHETTSQETDAGEGTSGEPTSTESQLMTAEEAIRSETLSYSQVGIEPPPPEYRSPSGSESGSDRSPTPRSRPSQGESRQRLIPPPRTSSRPMPQGFRNPPSPPIPSYEAATGRPSVDGNRHNHVERRRPDRRRGTR